MSNTINARVPLCGLSVFVHSITLRKASTGAPSSYYLHRHPGFELHCITAGDSQVKCNGKTYLLDSDTLLLLPPEAYHSVTDTPNKTVRISICFSLDRPENRNNDIANMFYRTFNHHTPLKVQLHNAEAQRILHKMESQLLSVTEDPYRKDKLLTLCCEFLLELANCMDPEITQQTTESAGEHSEEIDYWIDSFLALNFMHNDAMPRMADSLHISTRQLHRIIKEHYGTNYRQKLSETRLKIATDMLCNTDMPIHKISEVLGYSSSANFSAFIKRYTGQTPSQLRKSRKDI